MGVGEVISAIRRLTKEQITESLNEWDLISREKFLEIHRVHAAKKYWIRREDKRYDAKAILVRALRISDASLIDLNANSFDGNEFTVAEPLRSLGFVVEENSRQPKFWWVNQNQTFDEEIGGGFMWSQETSFMTT